MRTSTVSIELFGAVGDGVANDTAAFNAMVAYLSANGGVGYLPYGTFLIDPSSRTFTSNKPFVIRGEGKGLSVLKSRSPNGSFIYWTGGNNITLEEMTIDGAYTGTQNLPSGGNLVFVNSSYITVKNVHIQNFYRVGIMVYNDHQTTLTNVYSDIVIDGVSVKGLNKVDNTGPSAILLADVNNSRIQNCYCEDIGLYGFEFKNDCSNCCITNSTAKNTYYPVYFGGDGSHTELGYVKDSVVSGISIQGFYWAGIGIGRAWRNVFTGITMNATSSSYIPIDIDTSLDNVFSGIIVNGVNTGASYPVVKLRAGSERNSVTVDAVNCLGALTSDGVANIASGANNNTIRIGRCTANSGVPANLWSDSGTGNTKTYLS